MKIFPFIVTVTLATNVAASFQCQIEDLVKTCVDGNKKVISNLFEKTKMPSSVETYISSKLMKQEFFSINNIRVGLSVYDYQDNNTFFKTMYSGDNKYPDSKVLIQVIGNNEVILKNYGFDKKSHVLENIDSLNGEVITERLVINPDGDDFKYRFIYDGDRINGFDVFNLENEKIGDYRQNVVGDVPGGPREAAVKIAVIDSGFDHNHVDIKDHILINENESFNDLDSDGDGFKDNYIGVHFDGDSDIKFTNPFSGFLPSRRTSSQRPAGVYGIPFETIKAKGSTGPITSHGTHVSSIALKGLKSASLLAFAGDFGEAKYLDMISKKLQNSDVDFVNMSFSFPHQSMGMVDSATYSSLKRLFTQNPEVVFFVAAGNDGEYLNGSRDCKYPACYLYPNVVTIGATPDSSWRKDENYTASDYSNYSSTYVDFFAPGTKVEAALIGDMKIRHSGTSMASPMALNMAAKIKEAYPNMSALKVIEFMKKNAIKIDTIQSKYGVIRPFHEE